MPETPNPEVVTLFALVANRYGDRLTTEQLDEIKKMVEGQVEAARALRAVKLSNADEPFQGFTAYRSDATTPDRSALASPLEANVSARKAPSPGVKQP